MSKKKVNVKMETKTEIKKLKKGVSDFKKFISRGNVVDMAVGVIVGGAFGKIVTSLVNDILMPLIGTLLGGLNFTELNVKVGESIIAYGNFIQTIFDFLIVAFCIFLMIKFFEKFKKKEEVDIIIENKKSDEVLLLEQIRDLIRDTKNNK